MADDPLQDLTTRKFCIEWDCEDNKTLKECFRASARRHHPDKNRDNEAEALLQMQKLNNMRDKLKNGNRWGKEECPGNDISLPMPPLSTAPQDGAQFRGAVREGMYARFWIVIDEYNEFVRTIKEKPFEVVGGILIRRIKIVMFLTTILLLYWSVDVDVDVDDTVGSGLFSDAMKGVRGLDGGGRTGTTSPLNIRSILVILLLYTSSITTGLGATTPEQLLIPTDRGIGGVLNNMTLGVANWHQTPIEATTLDRKPLGVELIPDFEGRVSTQVAEKVIAENSWVSSIWGTIKEQLKLVTIESTDTTTAAEVEAAEPLPSPRPIPVSTHTASRTEVTASASPSATTTVSTPPTDAPAAIDGELVTAGVTLAETDLRIPIQSKKIIGEQPWFWERLSEWYSGEPNALCELLDENKKDCSRTVSLTIFDTIWADWIDKLRSTWKYERSTVLKHRPKYGKVERAKVGAITPAMDIDGMYVSIDIKQLEENIVHYKKLKKSEGCPDIAEYTNYELQKFFR